MDGLRPPSLTTGPSAVKSTFNSLLLDILAAPFSPTIPCPRKSGAAQSQPQQATLDALPTRHLKTGRAYRIRLAFQELYDQSSAEAATSYLSKWYFWATHSRLQPVIDAAHTVKRHWDGILRWFDSKIANGLIEGINSLVQAAKAKARGYRSIRNLKAIVYLLAGKLHLQLPA